MRLRSPAKASTSGTQITEVSESALGAETSTRKIELRFANSSLSPATSKSAALAGMPPIWRTLAPRSSGTSRRSAMRALRSLRIVVSSRPRTGAQGEGRECAQGGRHRAAASPRPPRFVAPHSPCRCRFSRFSEVQSSRSSLLSRVGRRFISWCRRARVSCSGGAAPRRCDPGSPGSPGSAGGRWNGSRADPGAAPGRASRGAPPRRSYRRTRPCAARREGRAGPIRRCPCGTPTETLSVAGSGCAARSSFRPSSSNP